MLNLEGLSSSLQTPQLPLWHVVPVVPPGLSPRLLSGRASLGPDEHASQALTLHHRGFSPSEASKTCNCF